MSDELDTTLTSASTFLEYIGKPDAARALSALATYARDRNIPNIAALEAQLAGPGDAAKSTDEAATRWPKWMAKRPDMVAQECQLDGAPCLAMHDPDGEDGLWFETNGDAHGYSELTLYAGVDGDTKVTLHRDDTFSPMLAIQLVNVLNVAMRASSRYNPYVLTNGHPWKQGQCLAMHDPYLRSGLWVDTSDLLPQGTVILRAGVDGVHSVKLTPTTRMADVLQPLFDLLSEPANVFRAMCYSYTDEAHRY